MPQVVELLHRVGLLTDDLTGSDEGIDSVCSPVGCFAFEHASFMLPLLAPCFRQMKGVQTYMGICRSVLTLRILCRVTLRFSEFFRICAACGC